MHNPKLVVDEANIAEGSQKMGKSFKKRMKVLSKKVRKDFNKWHRKGVSVDKLEPAVQMIFSIT